ncbi:MAG TPA: hypothetical protein PLL76_18200 [Thermoanaerobaculia bacterium]|nr:hypothetical protein [Thermoanaerobaculia bacterium]HQP88185.1 hypothetical protein [Thermoanaerobaculia bacterium]
MYCVPPPALEVRSVGPKLMDEARDSRAFTGAVHSKSSNIDSGKLVPVLKGDVPGTVK